MSIFVPTYSRRLYLFLVVEWRTGNFGADTAVSPMVLFYTEYLKIISQQKVHTTEWGGEKYKSGKTINWLQLLELLQSKQYQWTFIAIRNIYHEILKNIHLLRKIEKQFYLKLNVNYIHFDGYNWVSFSTE